MVVGIFIRFNFLGFQMRNTMHSSVQIRYVHFYFEHPLGHKPLLQKRVAVTMSA
jgi:hypothetical protein